MNDAYIDSVTDDPKLYSAVQECLPKLQRLDSFQIERLVFYLKSLHGYYPKSENHTSFSVEFSDKLDKLRSSKEQVELQRKAAFSALKALSVCVIAGMLVTVAIGALLGGQVGLGSGMLIVSALLVLFADTKLLQRALILSKEQDRRYFLSSIRAAKACNELDWAGLFAYNQASKTGPHCDADIAHLNIEIGSLTHSLRTALYNDEYFQYSPAELNDKSGA